MAKIMDVGDLKKYIKDLPNNYCVCIQVMHDGECNPNMAYHVVEHSVFHPRGNDYGTLYLRNYND